jgi:hypothetical protein
MCCAVPDCPKDEPDPPSRRDPCAPEVAGYSRLMGVDEEGTLERLKALRRELVDPKIAGHHGRIVKTTGDGMLVEFGSVVDAVRRAVAVQQAIPERTLESRRTTASSCPSASISATSCVRGCWSLAVIDPQSAKANKW